MSTLRISNIEAKSVPASATIDEKVKITNSSGDPLVFIDGKTSGITTVGINTTDPNITFDANSNVVVTGIITATKFSGQFEPTSVGIADSIFHTGDTDTSINFPAVDTIAFTTGGDRRVTINSDGNVIIGTSTWQYPKPLNVQGSSGSIISLYNGDTTTYAADTFAGIELKLRTGNTGNTIATCEIRAFKENGTNGNSARALSFYTGTNGGSPTERLRIDSDGRLLLGRQTVSHTSSKMEIQGGAEAYLRISPNTNTGTAGVVFGTADDHSTGGIYYNGSDDSLVLAGHDNDERFRVGAGGSVTHYCGNANGQGFYVLGHASQGRTTLAVRAGNTNSNAATSIRLQHANGTSVGNLSLDNDSNNYNMMNAVQGGQIVFHTNESGSSLPKMRIHPDGDVQLTAGNLVLPSSGGVVFDTVAGSVTSNTLDDYEEGSYIPTVTAGGTTYTYGTSNDYVLRSPHSTSNNNSISYTKIGNRVYVNFAIFWNITTSARYVITLPFTYRGSAYQLCTTPAFYRVDIDGDILGTLGAGSAAFDTYRTNKDTSNASHTTVPLTAASEVYYMICYETTE